MIIFSRIKFIISAYFSFIFFVFISGCTNEQAIRDFANAAEEFNQQVSKSGGYQNSSSQFKIPNRTWTFPLHYEEKIYITVGELCGSNLRCQARRFSYYADAADKTCEINNNNEFSIQNCKGVTSDPLRTWASDSAFRHSRIVQAANGPSLGFPVSSGSSLYAIAYSCRSKASEGWLEWGNCLGENYKIIEN